MIVQKIPQFAFNIPIPYLRRMMMRIKSFLCALAPGSSRSFGTGLRAFFLSFILFLLTTFLSSAQQQQQQQEKFSRVKIFADNEGLKQIAAKGVCVDHGEHKFNYWLITEISEKEIATIKSLGYSVEILVDDVIALYKNQNNSYNKTSPGEEIMSASACAGNCLTYPQPQNFLLGSMGGFFTFQEVMNNLDSMAAKFPGLITVKQSIGSGTSVEGRAIYYVKISDNPNADENEPEVLYNSLHHAREPESLSQLIYYMWYLLEHYGTDSTITYLVNTNELYFVPVVNPDGYVYNQTTNPNGGGLWRKNRKVNGDGTFGVDLNRNYAYNWGYDNVGSSPTTSSDTYRGASAASEPETQLIQNFINAHHFSIAVNNHTYSDVLIYPFGYASNTFTPDSNQFKKYAQLMTMCDAFGYGTANQTVGYLGNGAIDDWMYADTSARSKVLSFTPEAGASSDGFWPAATRIVPIAQNTMAQNIYAAKLAAQLADVSNSDKLFIENTNSYAHFNFIRLGMEPGTFTVSVIPVTANIISTGNPVVISNASLLQSQADSIFISLGTVNPGDMITYLLSVTNGAFSEYDTISRIFGTPVVAFTDSCNSVTAQWTSTSWGASTSQYVSSPASLTESPSGDYPNNVTRTITTNNYIDLTDAVAARFSFNAKWMIEAGYDYAEIQASTDGVNFTALCGKYTHKGNASQDLNSPVYDGYQNTWLKEEINLGDYAGQNIKLRFKFKSDGGVSYDGFYFDDALVEKVTNDLSAISDPDFSQQIKLFPNPAGEKIFLTVARHEGKTFSVCDVAGKNIYSGTLTQAQQEIDVSVLNEGIYFIRIFEGNNTSQPFTARKFVVLKN